MKPAGLTMIRWAAAAFATTIMLACPAAAATLDTVRERGHLVCGINEGLLGFATRDAETQKWSGFDVDFCWAVAIAIFNDRSEVEFVPVSSTERFDVLRSGAIDMLVRNTTWTISRELGYGLTFAGVNYYDGQGFMVPRASGRLSSLELDGSVICVLAASTHILNLPDYFKSNNMGYETVEIASPSDAVENYEDGRCDVITSDISQLFALRQSVTDPDEHVILPDAISKEPLGPVVRQDDGAWVTLVKWVHFALLNGEELGVGSDNIDEALKSKKPDVRRLVGVDGGYGEKMGIDPEWAANIIRSVGNYGEIFERNLGVESPLGIPRGMNQMWNRGGIQYAPPMR